MSLSPLDAPAIDLSAFDEAYANAGRSTSDPNLDVPDGQYRVMVEDVHVAETRTGKPMIHWSLRVVGPAEASGLFVPVSLPTGRCPGSKKTSKSWVFGSIVYRSVRTSFPSLPAAKS